MEISQMKSRKIEFTGTHNVKLSARNDEPDEKKINRTVIFAHCFTYIEICFYPERLDREHDLILNMMHCRRGEPKTDFTSCLL